jgi:hypothetical protein
MDEHERWERNDAEHKDYSDRLKAVEDRLS